MNNRRLSLTLLIGMLVEVINKLSPLLILHQVQDKLGLEYFGIVQAQIAHLDTLQPLVLFGYTHYVLASIAANKRDISKQRQIFSETLILRAGHGLILLAAIFLFGYPPDSQALQFSPFFFYLVLTVLSGVFDCSWYYLLTQKVMRFSLIGGLLRILSLVAIFVFVKDQSDGGAFIVISILPNLIMMVWSSLYAYRELGFVPVRLAAVQRVFRQALPYGVIYGLLILFERIDILMAEHWFDATLVGAYASSSRIVHSLLMLSAFVTQAFYSEIVGSDDESHLRKNLSLSIWCMLVIMVPIGFGTGFVESDVLGLIYNNNDARANGVLGLLCFGLIANAILTVFGQQVLQLKSQPWRLNFALLLGLIVTLGVAWTVQGQYGLPALAFSIVIGKLMAAVIALYFAGKTIGFIPWSPMIRVVLAGFFMYCALRLAASPSFLLNIVLGGAVYIAALIALNFAQVKIIADKLSHRLRARL